MCGRKEYSTSKELKEGDWLERNSKKTESDEMKLEK